jgi:hypothetical protein
VHRALEIGGRISESVEFDLVALLQIERIMQRADIECAPARTADRLLVEREIDAVQRDALRAGSKVGVALPADGAENRRREGRGLGGKRELLQIELDLLCDL